MTAPEKNSPARLALGFRFEEALAAAIMAVLCLITFANVVTRYLTSISFAFTEELSVFLLVVLTFVGAASAFRHGHHLSITFLVERLSPRAQFWQRRFALACSLLLFGVLVWYGTLMCWDDWSSGLTSPGLGVPQWRYTAAIPVLSLLVIWRLLQLLSAARRAQDGGDA